MPGGRDGRSLRSSRWLGVRHVRSWGSLELLVRGRPLSTDSTSARRVLSPSPSKTCSFVSPSKMRRVDRIRRSQAPPWWDALGALKHQVTSFWRRKASTCAWFHSCIACLSSLCAPTKLVPLSDRISFTWPRRATNLLNTLMKDGVSKEVAISMWTTPFHPNRTEIIHPGIGERGLCRGDAIQG